jgi:hypothetical protein
MDVGRTSQPTIIVVVQGGHKSPQHEEKCHKRFAISPSRVSALGVAVEE